MKKVYIIHGWDGYPEEAWIPWLKSKLEKQGLEVFAPAMPNTAAPKMDKWIPFLTNLVGSVDENTFFVGHSIGNQAILRFLQDLPENSKVGGIVMVAPWVNLLEMETEEEKILAKPWLETPIDFEKVKNHTKNIVAIFSDDDDCVPTTDEQIFKEKLNAKTFMEHGKGHFSGGDNITDLPIVFNELMKLINQ